VVVATSAHHGNIIGGGLVPLIRRMVTQQTRYALGHMILRVLNNYLDAWAECKMKSVAGVSLLWIWIWEHVPLW